MTTSRTHATTANSTANTARHAAARSGPARSARSCIGCARTYDPDRTGYHASRHWIAPPAGLVCRTCQARATAGTLDLAAIAGAQA